MSNEKGNIITDDLVNAFNIFDKDKDGLITVKELEAAMVALGYNLSNEEIRNLVSTYDTNASGTVGFNEFKKLMGQKIKEQEEENEILELFELYDRNGDGLLSKEELTMVLTEVGEKFSEYEISLFFETADNDQDGEINYYEFSKIMKSK